MLLLMLLRITYVRENRTVTDKTAVKTILLSLFLGELKEGVLFTGDAAGYVEESSGDGHLCP